MKRYLKLAISGVLFTILLLYAVSESSEVYGKNSAYSSEYEIEEIRLWVNKQMKSGKIPGVSVTIIKDGKTAYSEGFGYSDVKEKKPVTDQTLFELGSASKAFTALGIYKLEQEGKINLDNPVSHYIPWFQMKYSGMYQKEEVSQSVDITLNQLLHHTSGISFQSIADIPISITDTALEETIRTQVGKELDFYPGERFQYATINYDILGLVIQYISGISYEDYIQKNILRPLNMKNTYLFSSGNHENEKSKGYKYGYLSAMEYQAPEYRGNTPAGYVITCGKDMEKWLIYQMDNEHNTGLEPDLAWKSQEPDYTVLPSQDGAFYGAGWHISQKSGKEILHGGSNPNFSSFIIFRPEDKTGIAVLANLNTSYTDSIGKGIMEIIQGREADSKESDMYKTIDKFSTVLLIVLAPILFVILIFLFRLLYFIYRKKITFNSNIYKMMTTFFIAVVIMGIFIFCLYRLPDILFNGLNWEFIRVWGPESFTVVICMLIAVIFVFTIYVFISNLYDKSIRQEIATIAILSIFSGFGNSIVIFMINEALMRNKDFKAGLLYFLAGLLLYAGGQRIVRSRVIILTNELVFNKRVNIITNILHSSYQKFESVKNSEIMTVLNNDTEMISNFVNIIISGATSLITILCCLVYLGMVNFSGFMMSLILIILAAGLYFAVGTSANRMWEQTRDIQNIFFDFLEQLLSGIKELTNHKKRRCEFEQDMFNSCREYKEKKTLGDLGYAYVFIIGELLFTFVIGFLVFLFPIIIKNTDMDELRNFTLIFLYIAGPVNNVLNSIPQVAKVKISWKRIHELDEIFKNWEENMPVSVRKFVYNIKLNHICYSYGSTQAEEFILGPIDISFQAGEISFIIGGNGSGKSTLAKLITGLYTPQSGNIEVDGIPIQAEEIGELISAIYSDYYLFKKLFGINCEGHETDIKYYLKMLFMDEKIEIINNSFSTIDLSTGQRKRLALLVSFLEDNPIFLFDEWAADQDSRFKEMFYYQILPQLKKEGKCVIALTHDDRYFDIADKIIKMERGRVVEVTVNH